MTRDQFIYALTACGCLLKDGKTWYEHNELIKCFEDLGLLEQEPIIDKIRAEIESYKLSEDELTEMDEDSVKWGMKIAYDILDKHYGKGD